MCQREKLQDSGMTRGSYDSFCLLVFAFCLSVVSVLSGVSRYCFVTRKRNIQFSTSFGKPENKFSPLCSSGRPPASLLLFRSPCLYFLPNYLHPTPLSLCSEASVEYSFSSSGAFLLPTFCTEKPHHLKGRLLLEPRVPVLED